MSCRKFKPESNETPLNRGVFLWRKTNMATINRNVKLIRWVKTVDYFATVDFRMLRRLV